MRLSGVLPDDDDGSTDLATLEKRLADRASQRQTAEASTPGAPASEDQRIAPATLEPPQQRTASGTPTKSAATTPRSHTHSPELQQPKTRTKDGEKEDDTLADMMCSLVTNNYGETRYIGALRYATLEAPC